MFEGRFLSMLLSKLHLFYNFKLKHLYIHQEAKSQCIEQLTVDKLWGFFLLHATNGATSISVLLNFSCFANHLTKLYHICTSTERFFIFQTFESIKNSCKISYGTVSNKVKDCLIGVTIYQLSREFLTQHFYILFVILYLCFRAHFCIIRQK